MPILPSKIVSEEPVAEDEGIVQLDLNGAAADGAYYANGNHAADPESETESDDEETERGLPENGDSEKITRQHTGGGSISENVQVSSPVVAGSNQEPAEKDSETPEPEPIRSRGSGESENIAVREHEPAGDGFGLIGSKYYYLFYLKHFRFDDISVQLDGNMLLIEAKHGYYADEHGFAARALVRKQVLPDDAVPVELTSYFTGDGVLVVQVPCVKT